MKKIILLFAIICSFNFAIAVDVSYLSGMPSPDRVIQVKGVSTADTYARKTANLNTIRKLVSFQSMNRTLAPEERTFCENYEKKSSDVYFEFKKITANNITVYNEYRRLEQKYEQDSIYCKAVWKTYLKPYALNYYYQSLADHKKELDKKATAFNAVEAGKKRKDIFELIILCVVMVVGSFIVIKIAIKMVKVTTTNSAVINLHSERNTFYPSYGVKSFELQEVRGEIIKFEKIPVPVQTTTRNRVYHTGNSGSYTDHYTTINSVIIKDYIVIKDQNNNQHSFELIGFNLNFLNGNFITVFNNTKKNTLAVYNNTTNSFYPGNSINSLFYWQFPKNNFWNTKDVVIFLIGFIGFIIGGLYFMPLYYIVALLALQIIYLAYKTSLNERKQFIRDLQTRAITNPQSQETQEEIKREIISNVSSQRVDDYFFSRSGLFPKNKLTEARSAIENISESRFTIIKTLKLAEPNNILIASIILGGLGIDRFMLGQTATGILKILIIIIVPVSIPLGIGLNNIWLYAGGITALGLAFLWVLLDIIYARSRAKEENFRRLMKTIKNT